MIQFEWDVNNIRHVSEDHPERANTLQEVESVFDDPNLIIKTGTLTNTEQRFNAIGKGASGEIRVVVFTLNNHLIRPVSCWRANKQTIRFYHENTQKP